MPARTVLGALALDAFDEFARAIEAIPAPGRHRRLGRLNAPAWSIGHLASSADAWVNVFCRRVAADAWCDALFARQRAAPRGAAVDVDLDEARAAFARFVDRARPYLEGADGATLRAMAGVPPNPGGRTSVPAAYLVARAAAHTFVHAGELTVVASLVGAGDLGLPGKLARSREATAAAPAADTDTTAVLAALARDAREELDRVAQALPRAAYGPLFAPRLSAGATIVAHAALTQDRFWNERVQHLDRDPWLRELRLEDAPGGATAPIDFDEALVAYRRVCERSDRYLSALEQLAAGGEPAGSTDAFGLAWSAAHLFAHCGELATIGSLVGGPDLGLPGQLPRTTQAVEASA
jgi:DinB superfamily